MQWELDRKLDQDNTVCARRNQTFLSIVPNMELLCFVLTQVDFDFIVHSVCLCVEVNDDCMEQ